MNVFRLNQRAEIPTPTSDRPGQFDIKACFDLGSKVSYHNSVNKENFVPVRVISGNVCVQVYPAQRVTIPTGLIFDVPQGHILRLMSAANVTLKKGLVIVDGTGIINPKNAGEAFVTLHNISDTPAIINDGESIALGMLEYALVYDITETSERPS